MKRDPNISGGGFVVCMSLDRRWRVTSNTVAYWVQRANYTYNGPLPYWTNIRRIPRSQPVARRAGKGSGLACVNGKRASSYDEQVQYCAIKALHRMIKHYATNINRVRQTINRHARWSLGTSEVVKIDFRDTEARTLQYMRSHHALAKR